MKPSAILENNKSIVAVLGVAALVSLSAYLIASAVEFRIGFPLDDAWIHQTYARNLALNGGWTFLPNQPSGGSTAPGWSLLLALGYWMHLGPYIWTFFMGWLLLWGLAVAAAFGLKLLLPNHPKLSILAGLLMIFEWHMVWAAGSGMDTILFALIALVVLLLVIYLVQQQRAGSMIKWWHWFSLGLLIGLGIWVRPDGITLIGVVGFALLLSQIEYKQKLTISGLILCSLIITILPYLYFNVILSGEIWPNTFFAKQSEYAVLRELPYWQRYLNISRQPLTGIGIVLLPGFLWFAWRSVINRRWAEVAGVIWIIGYLGVFAWRLPVIYQHGRYIMPIIPAFCLFGLAGLVFLFDLMGSQSWGRIIRRSGSLIAVLVLLGFWFLGVRAYAEDVAIIESEMVATAKWIARNTGQESLVAAHDIGALGYFSGRELLDLAGLISPEVIPIIRDEIALEHYLDVHHADYLMTFPGWYSSLTQNRELIFRTKASYSPAAGGENMSVYKLDTP